jgi:glycerophosphoryl diester phosphodiesterase
MKTDPTLAPWPLPRWIAHRGAGKLAPENTLAAFREGARHGYRAFECDVKLSADGVPFLLHDDSLQRTTNGYGVAGRLPWSPLALLDAGGWHSAAYAGEPPASLAAIAAWLQANGGVLDLEIKPTPGEEERTGREVALAVKHLWAGRRDVPLLSSFSPEALAAAQAAAPELPRALLLDSDAPGWWDTLQRLDAVALIAHHRLLDETVVRRLHAAGLRALAYTVNQPDEAARLWAAGADGLITDAVDRFRPDAD